MRSSEPHNPFYLFLLLASVLFAATALAYALVPSLEEKAVEAGQVPPQSAFRDALRTDGWQWLLYEVGAMILFGVLSMGLDRLRTLKKERAQGNNINQKQETGNQEPDKRDAPGLLF